MSNLTTFSLNNTIIMPTSSAAVIMKLLEDAHDLRSSWSDDSISITREVDFTFSGYSEDKFNDIIKAQVLGMTYKEYTDAQRITKDSLQEDKDISTESE